MFFFVMADASVFMLLYVLVTSVQAEIASFYTHFSPPVNVIVALLSVGQHVSVVFVPT